MARPIKSALDYYPIDVDFLQQIAVRKMVRCCAASSIAVLIALYGRIFGGQGYYLEWDPDTIFVIADECGLEEEEVQKVVDKAMDIRFFDREMYSKFNILTSVDIQEKFFDVMKRSRRKYRYNSDYLLVEVESFLPEITPVYAAETQVSAEKTPINAAETQNNILVNGIPAVETGIPSAVIPQTKLQQTKPEQNELKKTKLTNFQTSYSQSCPQDIHSCPDSYQHVATKDDLRALGFTDERSLRDLMRAVQEHGITQEELRRYDEESKKGNVRSRMNFLYMAIISHYIYND